MQGSEDLAVRIVERVADREGVDPIELTPPLHDVVDTEALESLFARRTQTEAEQSVTFTYRGHTIRVEGSEVVRVVDSPAEVVAGCTDG